MTSIEPELVAWFLFLTFAQVILIAAAFLFFNRRGAQCSNSIHGPP